MQRYIESGAFHKKGATFNLIIELEPDEFTALFPNDGVSCNVRIRGEVFSTLVQISEPFIVATANTNEWTVGMAELDIKIQKNGSVLLIPQDGIITFDVIPSIT